MRHSGFVCVCAFVLAILPAASRADVVAGAACTQLGQTTMTTNNKSIVGCLLSTPDTAASACNGKCIWKVISGGASSATTGCPTGFAVIGNADNPLGCIQKAENASSTHTGAMNSCYAQYGGRLPFGGELYVAIRQYGLAVGAGAVPAGKHLLVNWIDSVYLLPNGSLGARGIDMGSTSTYAGESLYPQAANPPVEWAGYGANSNSYRYRCYLPSR